MTETTASVRIMPVGMPMTAMGGVAALAAFCWYLEPDEALIWAGVALLPPLAWAVIAFFRRGKNGVDEVRRALFFASLMLIFSLSFAAASSLDLFDPDGRTIVSNTYGLLMGAVLIFMGNYIPKRLPPLDEARYDIVKVQVLQRFAGWAFVVAGIGYALAWLILPTTPANIVATGLTLLATVLVVGRRVLTRLRS